MYGISANFVIPPPPFISAERISAIPVSQLRTFIDPREQNLPEEALVSIGKILTMTIRQASCCRFNRRSMWAGYKAGK